MSIQDIASWISAIASVAGAAGVLFAFRQLRLSKLIAQTQFEDNLAREYRELAATLPVEALLGEDLPDEEYMQAFPRLYRYIDLCNEQIFLRQQERVRPEVWNYWSSGIQSNLDRPAFARAWREIRERCDSFQELRRASDERFERDPACW